MKTMKTAVIGSKQSGFTIVETLVVLGILAVFIGAVVALAGGTSATQVAQTEARIMDSAASKLKNVYNARPTFAGLNTAVANDLEVWNASMGDPAVNTFGGVIQVQTPPGQPKGAAAAGARQFQMDWPSVTHASCPELASAASGAIGVDVDGAEVYNEGVSPLDVGAIAANCAEGVTVSFIYSK